MKLNVEKVSNVRWADPHKQHINMDVKFKEYDFVCPFTAGEGDVEEHGRLLYDQAMQGVYGEIGDYPEPSDEVYIAEAQREKQKRLTEARNTINDYSELEEDGELTEAQAKDLANWRAYRKALMQIESQDGYPKKIEWPERPA